MKDRAQIVQRAKDEISDTVLHSMIDNNLTYYETLQILNDQIAVILEFCLFKERHPDLVTNFAFKK